MNKAQRLLEHIKNWKHAHSDMAKIRASKSAEGKTVHTVSITKKGEINKMDTRKAHDSEEQARDHIANIKRMNPHLQNKKSHRLFVAGKDHEDI